jgi:trans-aconitate 2-methyltransferase
MWSASQYVKFESERTRPVRDLLAAVSKEKVGKALDLGCGPGNSTEVLALLYPEARIHGVDSSENMIEAARRRLTSCTFEVADIGSWNSPEKWDIILANAVFHWIPEHEMILPRLVGMLAAGGSLAIQMPDNENEPSHLLMWEIAGDAKWKERLQSALSPRTKIESPYWYYALLQKENVRVDLWRTVYYHSLAGIDTIVEWFKGSGLRPYLAALNDQEQKQFIRRYTDHLAEAYPLQSDGTVLLAFPRFFIVATKEISNSEGKNIP